MARNTRRGTPQLLIAAAFTAFLALAVLATSVSGSSAAPAQTSGAGSLCQIKGFPSGGGSKKSTGNGGGARASITGFGAAKGLGRFVVEKAVGANLERWGVQGLSGFFRLVGLGSIAPDSGEQRLLGQLRAINTRLGEIEVRIDRVGDRVNRLIGTVQRAEFNRAITKACNIASEQVAMFRTYTTALDTGLKLGAILEGRVAATPSQREALENRMLRDIDEFVSDYRQHYARYSGQIDDLRRMLVPSLGNGGTTPVLTIFGKVLLSRDRFLHPADSEAMRALYEALSEIRALATLMAAEYWDGRKREADEQRVLREFVTDTRNAEARLPKMIPPGVIIDLGNDRDSANAMPMWFAPTKKDLGWIPSQNAGLEKPIADEEVDDALRKLNAKQSMGKGWSAPTKGEFEALISTGCRVDPDHPARALRGCVNAVPRGSNIAAYLQRLNKEDGNWQQLFCQRLTNPNCPPGAGPTTVRRPPHAFIWTSDRHSQRLICGRWLFRGSFNSHLVDVRFATYAGFHTLAADARFHEVFPHLPQGSPNSRNANGGPEVVPSIRKHCFSYFRELVLGGRGRRNHLTEGVLLATRYTGPQDANPISHWDFMAQTVPGLGR